jgi:hypothetical protein
MILPFFNAPYASDGLAFGHLLHRRLRMGQHMNNHEPHFLIMLFPQEPPCQLHHLQQGKFYQNVSLTY